MNNILDYWYELEFLSLNFPIDFKKDINLNYHDLPWPKIEDTRMKRTTFDVYIGESNSLNLIEWMIDACKLPFDSKRQHTHGSSCLCAIKVDSTGLYVPNSFAVSSFTWAICQFVKNGLNVSLDVEHLEKLHSTINKSLIDDGAPVFINQKQLTHIYTTVCKEIGIDHKQITSVKWAKTKIQRGDKVPGTSDAYEFPPLSPATELMSSFYFKDIKKVRNCPTTYIENYILAMNRTINKDERIQIDSNVDQMQTWLKADRYPMGIWPSKYNPCLMQQISINLAISDEQSIFSVNGPPGTGKTTLLKEIIVSNIVERAIALSALGNPDDAFVLKEFSNPPDEFSSTYYVPNKSLTQYGILVASNNNAAVENISVELPKTISEDRSGYFANTDIQDSDDYFADLSTNLLGASSWGLISAKLGNTKNIKHLVKSLREGKNGENILKYYNDKDTIPNWETAKMNFNTARKAVEDARENISYAQTSLQKYKTSATQLETKQTEYEQSQINCTECERTLTNSNNTLEKLLSSEIVINENITTLVQRLSFIKRTFWKSFKQNLVIQEWKENERKLESLIIEITRQRSSCNEQVYLLNDSKQIANDCLIHLQSAQHSHETVYEELLVHKKHFGKSFPDDNFWDDIVNNKNSQEISPWTTFEYDKLREVLFYQSLMLHKSFVLNSNGVNQNLNRLFKIWEDQFTSEDKKRAYGSLLNTLWFLIPVISTTFASVEKFLGDIGPQELGLLVIDESGQATPKSALGAIWRTNKAIIVGDPLQVEPIVTVPKKLQNLLAKKHNIPSVYRVPELSVQHIGDKLNRFGGLRTLSGQALWLGCPLVLHRRCLDPMFSISNEVAYNNRMFLKTMPPKDTKSLLSDFSYWVDVQGTMTGKGNQNVQEQNNQTIKLFELAWQKKGDFPNLYIITPFKKIGEELKKELFSVIKKELSLSTKDYTETQIGEWLKEHCGTVHTFQGKEADEVILVLGCDSSIGSGAAKWVGQKPNIINVAVSRAKYRLYVVGDYSQWSSIPNVMVVCKHLKRVTPKDIVL